MVSAAPKPGNSMETAKALQNIFGISAGDQAGEMRAFSKLFKIYDGAAKCIEQAGGEMVEAYMHSLVPVRAGVLRTSLGSGWFGNNFLTPPELSYLRVTAEALKNDISEEEMEAAALKEIEDQIRELLHEVGDADIRTHLKKAMISALHRLAESIKEYQYFGAEGIERAVESAAGTVWVNSRDSDLNETEKTFVKKYSEVLAIVADTVAAATAAYQVSSLAAPTVVDLFLK
jgi:hypothetical protein